jgi:hypothetical protein
VLDEIHAAIAAAEAYVVRNEADGNQSSLVQNLLADALAHASVLDEVAEAFEKNKTLREAESALLAAQAAHAAPPAAVAAPVVEEPPVTTA